MSDIGDGIVFKILVCLLAGDVLLFWCCESNVYYVAQVGLVCVEALPQPFMLK